MNTRILKAVMSILLWLLIALSFVSIIFASLEAFSLSFDFSSKGLQYLLDLFEPYSVLYGATFIVLTTSLAINRLGLLMNTNRDSFKIGNRTAWIETVNFFLNDIEDNDPYMRKFFKRNMLDIHDYLFDHNYRFESKNSLDDFFNRFAKNEITKFEQQNRMYQNIGGFYKNDSHSYSYDSFRYVFENIIKLEDSYSSLRIDLQNQYQDEVRSIPKRVVSQNQYIFGLEAYKGI